MTNKRRKIKENIDDAFAILGIILFGALIGFLINGAMYGDAMRELGINKDEFAKNYVLEYYPEYEGCDLDFDAADNAVAVYCNDARDDLELMDKNPIGIKLKKPVLDLFKEEVKKCFAGWMK